jgi:hypothetical protein
MESLGITITEDENVPENVLVIQQASSTGLRLTAFDYNAHELYSVFWPWDRVFQIGLSGLKDAIMGRR